MHFEKENHRFGEDGNAELVNRREKSSKGFSNRCFAMVYVARGVLENDDGAGKDARYSDENDLNPGVRRKAKRKVSISLNEKRSGG
ncbi:uncharacterized protein G2W53_003848 [Senna tora]|uniref:Uncharacterized protein n=1 Tax=Senna tora TaxID=362788 RepID=A0A834XBH3_9FABA|nr:uncharacterized protein G2W53_003848 [Senna tora]